MSNPRVLELVERYDTLRNKVEQQAINRLHIAMDRAYRSLEAELRNSYTDLKDELTLLPAQRKLLILDKLGDTLDILDPTAQRKYQTLLQDLIKDATDLGADAALAYIQAIDPKATIAQFAGIPIEAVALQAQDGVKRLFRYAEDFRNKASVIVEQGLIQGWGVGRVSDGMRQQLGITKGKAEMLTRTEMSSALNGAASMRYEQNGIEGEMWLITPSEGLCPFCAARNGNVYKVGEGGIPAHPRCLCFKVPWKPSWQEQGLIDDAFIADFRQQNLDALKAVGQKPNYGPAPFERSAGLTEAPTPIWTP